MRPERGYQQQPSRRHLLQGAAVGSAGLVALTFIGCGQEKRTTTPTEAPAAVQPRRGGILRRSGGQAGTYDTRGAPFDPHTISNIGARGYRLMYQGLLAYESLTFTVKPELAQKWEQRSPTEYVFTLAPNVKWHNKPPAHGRLLTADDVVFSLERVRTRDPRFVHSSLLALVDKIEAVDKATVRITTKEPDAATLDKLASDGMLVLAPEVIEKVERFTTPQEVVGTGAFILQSALEGVSGEYVRNPDYWKPGLPYLDGIRTLFFNESQTAYAAFLGGQLDISIVPGEETKKHIAQQPPDSLANWFPQDFIQAVQPNVRMKPLDDSRVWKALKLLIDHDECKTAGSETWHGRGRHGSVLAPAMDSWDLSEEEYSKLLEWRQPKDQAVREALALLSAAGFTRDNPLRFEISSQVQPAQAAYAQLLQAQWRRLSQGVVLTELNLLDFATSNRVRSERSFALYQGGHAGSIAEPDTWFTQLYRTGASRNYSGFSDARLDAMIDRQRGIFDIAQRKAAVREIILYMIDNAPWTSSSNYFVYVAVRPQVRGWVPEGNMQGNNYEQFWLTT